MLILRWLFFDSPDGRFLAFGSSDYTIGILDANTLSVRLPCLLLIAAC
jgi:WD40 repeat protein